MKIIWLRLNRIKNQAKGEKIRYYLEKVGRAARAFSSDLD